MLLFTLMLVALLIFIACCFLTDLSIGRKIVG